ncbi:serine/arginine repetitive matrix protein 1-like [Brassica napus]|nr:serine/arginine repetitive matrix protein 1-like [Brassica napus]XP_048629394.1 serine/arginine repetitive matrix protein 1-like [Brassica napus]
MQRRLSSSEKGKAVALEHLPAPRKARVRVMEPDITALKQKHSLTIIGRVTNPSVQKVWSLLPFFTEHWKADIPPTGSDLGLGMFQFQFELESDLLTVLEKQPYHFARWMIILQRWEPTCSPEFPSMIPFWIKIHGVPIHLWTEETIRSLGKDIGTFETAEITSTSIRMRVHVNGRLPLIKKSILEYPNGDEVAAVLVYERLERHCSQCGRLDHELRDCLEAKALKRALLANQTDEPKNKEAQHLVPRSGIREPNPSTDKRWEHAPRRLDYSRSLQSRSSTRYSTHNPTHGAMSTRYRSRDPPREGGEYQKRSWRPKDSFVRDSTARKEDLRSLLNRTETRKQLDTVIGDSQSDHSHKSRYNEEHRARVEERLSPATYITPRQSTLASPRNGPHQLDRGIPLRKENENLPKEAVDAAMGEIRNYMTQYASCADPMESAARKERLRQAEERGQVEESAMQMVKASMARENEGTTARTSQEPSSNERLPATARLGPIDQAQEEQVVTNIQTEGGHTEKLPMAARLGPTLEGTSIIDLPPTLEAPRKQKRKPGRPPGGKKIASPALAPGSGLRKRKVTPKPTTSRRRVTGESERPRKAARASHTRASQQDTPSSTDNIPIVNLIPPSARRRMDFRAPSHLAP